MVYQAIVLFLLYCQLELNGVIKDYKLNQVDNGFLIESVCNGNRFRARGIEPNFGVERLFHPKVGDKAIRLY